jgi:hypothetical protein
MKRLFHKCISPQSQQIRQYLNTTLNSDSYLLSIPIQECNGKQVSYGKRIFTMPKLSLDNGIVLKPKKPNTTHLDFIQNKQSQIQQQVQVISKPFDIKYLELEDHNPIAITPYQIDKELFSNKILNPPFDYLRVLDMCVSVSGSNEYYLPKELEQFSDVIQQMIDIEHTINPLNANNYWAYVTVDQMAVEPSQTQRRRGCHIDGMEGPRIQPKVLPGHSYLICDKLPPVFYTQGFTTLTKDIDVLKDNIYDYFEENAREEETMIPNPYEIYMFTAYCVHRSDIAQQYTDRTVLRLYYACREFDRLGNTYNPVLPDKDYKNWAMTCRVWKDDMIESETSSGIVVKEL